MNTYKTCIPPILGVFPCSQAHSLLTCGQPDPKDKCSQIKKKTKKDDIFTKTSATAPLRSPARSDPTGYRSRFYEANNFFILALNEMKLLYVDRPSANLHIFPSYKNAKKILIF